MTIHITFEDQGEAHISSTTDSGMTSLSLGKDYKGNSISLGSMRKKWGYERELEALCDRIREDVGFIVASRKFPVSSLEE